MKKSNDLRQCGSWDKSKYDPGDGEMIVTSKSERMGDNTPESRGKHGEAQGRKNRMSGNGVNQTAAILDRNPARSVKPWADAPAEPVSTHGHSHWTPAVDAGAHPPALNDQAHGAANVKGLSRDGGGSYSDETDMVTKSGEHNWLPADAKVHKSWKKKNYSMNTPSELPDGELKRKWSK